MRQSIRSSPDREQAAIAESMFRMYLCYGSIVMKIIRLGDSGSASQRLNKSKVASGAVR